MKIFININILIALSLLPVAPSHHTPENLGFSFCTVLFYRNIIGEDFNMMMMMICCHSVSLVLNMITIMLLKMDNDDAKHDVEHSVVYDNYIDDAERNDVFAWGNMEELLSFSCIREMFE